MPKIDIAAVMNACDAKRQKLGLEALNSFERAVTLVSYVDFERTLGGLGTFYFNSAGDYAEETVSALEQIGAVRAAEAVRRANSLFPGGHPSRNRKRRWAAWKKLTIRKRDPFEKPPS